MPNRILDWWFGLCERLAVARTVAQRIVRVRDRLGITDAEIARRLDVTRSTVHAWVHGVNEPNLASLRRLSKALECELTELIGAS